MNHSSRSRLPHLVLAGVALCMLATSSRIASAAWPEFGRGIVVTLGAQQHPVITTDGAGGAIIAWQDFRTPPSLIVAHHVLATGELDLAWPHFGRVLMGAPLENPNGGQILPVIVSDGAGGAIVAWQDGRSAATGSDLYAQHVLANGQLDPAWPILGVPISTAPGIQVIPIATSDGAGGAIVAWLDDRPGSTGIDIYAQRVLASGVVDPQWPANGFLVCASTVTQQGPVIASDGSGGVTIAWFEARQGANTENIFAQRITGNGAIAPGWPVDGRLVCGAAGLQIEPTIVTDGAQGAVIAWSDARTPGALHVFAQHLLGSGTIDPAWPLDGAMISGAELTESQPRAVADGAGGAIVTWEGFTNHPMITNIFAQHVLATGVVDPAWSAGGVALSFRQKFQRNAEIASDGAGGAFVTWDENSQDVFAQHVLANGSLDPEFPADGRALCNLPSQQGDVAIVATGGGAIVTWADLRDPIHSGVDIFAIQVLNANPTDVPVPAPASITFAPAFPNPARGSLSLRFVLSHETTFRLAIYDVAGRRVRELGSGARPAGEHTLAWDMRDEAGREVSSGVYFARLDADRQSLSQKLVKVR